MKLYPALFALLYLARREFRAFAACTLLTLLLTLGSLATFEGGMVANARAMLAVLRTCDVNAATGTHVVQQGSSFYGMLRSIWFLSERGTSRSCGSIGSICYSASSHWGCCLWHT